MRRTLIYIVTGLPSVSGIAAIAILVTGAVPELAAAQIRTSAPASETKADTITLSCAEHGSDRNVEFITINTRSKVVRVEFSDNKVVWEYRNGEYRSLLQNGVAKEYQFVALSDDFITWGSKGDKGEITRFTVNRKTGILSGYPSSSLSCSVKRPF